MNDKQVIELIRIITEYADNNLQALRQDDPDSRCAANHRGNIEACGYILKQIQKLMYEKEVPDATP